MDAHARRLRSVVGFGLGIVLSVSLPAQTPIHQRGFEVLDYDVQLAFDEVLQLDPFHVVLDLLVTRRQESIVLDLVEPIAPTDAAQSGASDEASGVEVTAVTVLRAPAGRERQAVPTLRFEHRDRELRIFGVDAVGRWRIEVRLRGQPRDGLIRSRNRHGEWVVFADHWPNRASFWLPSIDHPSSKARYLWQVEAPSRVQVVANGELIEQTDLGAGRRRTVWRSAQPLAAKVAVVGVAEFAKLRLPVGDTPPSGPMFLWAYPQDAERAAESFADAAAIRRQLEKVLGPLPYPRLDHVQSTTRYGGMENAGAIFYGEKAVVSEAPIDSLIAHEMAHQWFGDGLTEASWADTWLSEGFATFLTLWVTEQRQGAVAAREARARARRAVLRLAQERPASVVRPESEPPKDRILNAYTYQKGAWALHMLRRRLGDQTFFALVRRFLERHLHGTAGTDDFLRLVGEVRFDQAGDPEAGYRTLEELTAWLFRSGHPQVRGGWSVREGVLRVRLEQVQAWPPFELPLEVAWGTHRETVRLGPQRLTEIEIELGDVEHGGPEDVVLDPDVELLFEELEFEQLEEPATSG